MSWSGSSWHGTRPEPTVRPISAEVEGSVAANLETTFAVFASIDLSSILLGYGPLPAVESVIDQQGDWDKAGQTREIRLADGSRMREELTLVEAPHRFAYRVDGFTGPLRHLVREMRGAWSFAPGQDTAYTRARWRYEFLCTRPIAIPPSVTIIRLLWRPMMSRALASASSQAEAASAKQEQELGGRETARH